MDGARTRTGLEPLERAHRDLGLIDAYRRGAAAAFDQLVAAYEATVQRVLVQLGADSSDIDDLTQDVFVRVFRNLHRFRGQSSFYTWLYRITVNVCFDHAKKRKRADVRLHRLQRAFDEGLARRIDPDDPFHAAYEKMTSDDLIAAIGRLPEPFRDVVAMREVDDLSYEEIASQTGVSIGTVRSRLSRARARLKDALGAERFAAA